MITIKSLKLINFLSHTETKLDFNPRMALNISGKSGSGKSSIVDAILFNFYGKGRTDNKSLIKRGEKSSEVIVELFDDENNIYYKIERKITSSKHELKLYEKTKERYFLAKVNGVKETQEFIEKKILRSSYLLFTNSIIIPQNNSESFVNQTAAKKKDLILEIINANNYDDYLKKTKEKISDTKESKILLESRINNKKETVFKNQEVMKTYPGLKEKEKTMESSIKKIKEDIDVLNSAKNSLAKDIASIDYKRQDLSITISKINELSFKIESYKMQISRLDSIDIDTIKKRVDELNVLKAELDIMEKSRQEYYDWNDKMTTIIRQSPVNHDYDKDIAEVNRQLIEAMMEKVEACPKCGEPYPRTEEVRMARVGHLENMLKIKKEEKNRYIIDVAEYERKTKELGEKPLVDLEKIKNIKGQLLLFDEYQKKLIEASEKNNKIEDIKALMVSVVGEIDELNKKKLSLEFDIKNGGELLEKNREFEKQIDAKDLLLNYNNSQISTVKAEIMIAEKAIKETSEMEKEIEVLRKEYEKKTKNLDALENLKDAFGPTGIKTIMIDMLVPQLEDSVNNILSRLSDFRVKIDTQKSGIGKDVVLEGLWITIINEMGEEMSFENYSGGERIAITMSINEALASISRVGLRCLDETIIALDDTKVSKFLEVLAEIQKDVAQVICISHIDEVKNFYNDKIEIIKINGNSTIK